MIKWAIVILCIVGIALTWFLTWVILGIHAVHGISTVVEFESLDLIDKARLAELVKDPRYEGYSIYGQVRSIGATNHYFQLFCVILTGVFVVIAILALAIPPANPTKHIVNKPD